MSDQGGWVRWGSKKSKEPIFAPPTAEPKSPVAGSVDCEGQSDSDLDLKTILQTFLKGDDDIKTTLAEEMKNFAEWGDFDALSALHQKDPAGFKDVLNHEQHGPAIARATVGSNNVAALRLVLDVGESSSKKFLGVNNFFRLDVHLVDWLPSNSSGLEMMEAVLAAGADPNRDENGTILHWIALAGLKDKSMVQRQIDLITLLVRYGADINAMCKVDRTSLLGIDVLKRGRVAPLHLLALEASGEVIGRMVELGAEIDICTSETTDTPLHLAVRGCNVDGVKALMHAGANTSKKNKKGEMPLHKLSRKASRLDSEKDRRDIIDLLRSQSRGWWSFLRFGAATSRDCCH